MAKSNKIAIAFGLACLAYGLAGCSATALSAAEPAGHSPQRWGDIAGEQQLCARLGGDGCAECAGRPDAAACYRLSYLSAVRAASRAANPFAMDAYVDPFAPEEAPAPGSQAMAEQIQEGAATNAIHLVEERLSAAVQP